MSVEMMAMMKKLESHQPLSQGEEALWVCQMINYHATEMKEKAISVAGISDSSQWPSNRWPTTTTLAVAMILDRYDALAVLDYTILQAVERLDPIWINSLRKIQAELINEGVVKVGPAHGQPARKGAEDRH